MSVSLMRFYWETLEALISAHNRPFTEEEERRKLEALDKEQAEQVEFVRRAREARNKLR